MKSTALSQYIANAHFSRVRLLFQKYGIVAEPTAINIDRAVLNFKNPFLKELYDIYISRYNNFSDPAVQADLVLPAQTPAKKIDWNSFKNIYTQDLPLVVSSTLSIVDTARQIINPNYYNPATMGGITQVDYEKQRTVRIIGISAVVIGVLVLVLYFTSKRKK